MSPFHGEDQEFNPPTGYFGGIIILMFSGGVTVAQRFLVPLVEVRIFTGEFCLGNSMVECLTCNEVVGGSIPLLSFLNYEYSLHLYFFSNSSCFMDTCYY